jgi:hypothetical protein
VNKKKKKHFKVWFKQAIKKVLEQMYIQEKVMLPVKLHDAMI